MSLQAAADVPLLISSPNSSSERRISPSWTIAHLKTRLEPITGVPAGSQQLTLRVGSQDGIAISAADEEQTQLAAFPLQPYAEITVSALRPSYGIAPSSLVPERPDLAVLSQAATSRRFEARRGSLSAAIAHANSTVFTALLPSCLAFSPSLRL